MKKRNLSLNSIPAYWAFAAGLLSVAAQVFMYFLRFGRWNTESPFSDYIFFFIAGSLGGAILIFFLNRQVTLRGRWIVLIAFLLASPISLFMMLGGGLFGPIGLLLLPQISWALFAWLGSLLGRLASGERQKHAK